MFHAALGDLLTVLSRCLTEQPVVVGKVTAQQAECRSLYLGRDYLLEWSPGELAKIEAPKMLAQDALKDGMRLLIARCDDRTHIKPSLTI